MNNTIALSKLKENLPLIISEFDNNGLFLVSEGSGLENIGRRPGESVGKSVFEIYKNHPGICNAVRKALNGEIVKGVVNEFGRSFQAYLYPIYDENGSIEKVISIAVDITDQRKIESELIKSEQRLKKAAHIAKIGNWEFDPKSNRFDFSEEVLRIFEIKPEECDGSYEMFLDRIHPDDRKILNLIFQNGSSDPILNILTIRILLTDGRIKSALLEWEINKQPLPNPGLLFGTIQDITELKKSELLLSEKERRYNMLFETMTDGFVSINMEGKFVEYNNAFKDMLGYTDDELQKLTFRDITPLKWHEIEKEIIENQVLINGYSEIYEKEYFKKDGSVVPVELRAYLIKDEDGHPNEMWGIIRDISERKEKEKFIRESSEKLELMYKGMNIGFVKLDNNGRFLEFNDSFRNMLGYSEAELKSLTFPEITPEHWHKSDVEILETQLFPQGYCGLFEKEFIAKDGAVISIETMGAVVYNHKGEPDGIWAWVRDITQRKKYLELLEKSEERFNNAFIFAPIGKALVSPEGYIIKSNPALSNIFGYTSKEMISLNFRDITYPEDLHFDLAFFEKVLNKELTSSQFEKRYFHKSGRIIWALLHVSAVFDRSGNLSYFISQVLDITERKTAEEEIKRRDELLRLTQKLTKVGGWKWDSQKELMYWTDELYELHGFHKDQFNPNSPEHINRSLECYDPEDAKLVYNSFLDCTKYGKTFDFELPFTSNSGRKFWIRTSGQPIYEGEKIIGAIGNFMDISDRKETELIISKQADQFNSILRTITEGFWIVDKSGNLLEVNDSYCRTTGYSREQLLAMKIVDLEATENESETRRHIERIIQEGEEIFESRHRKSDGTIFPVEVAASYDRNRGLFFVFIQDITKRKRAEEDLKLSEQGFRFLIENSPDIIITIDTDARILFMNRTRPDITPEQLIGTNSFDYLPEEDRERYRQALNSVFQNNTGDQFEHRARGVWYKTRILPFKDRNGNPIAMLISTDITESRQNQKELEKYREHLEDLIEQRTEELRQSERNFRNLAENSKDSILRFDTDLRFIYVNPVVEKNTGIKSNQLLGKKHNDFNYPENLVEFWQESLKECIKTKEIKRIEYEFPAGNWIDAILIPEFNFQGDVVSVISSGREITAIKKSEAAISEALKKEKDLNNLKNQFISTVSHEFRTPLTSILTSAGFLEMSGDKIDPDKKSVHFGRIMKNINSMITLLDDVLIFNKIDRGHYAANLEEIDIKVFATELFDEIKALYPAIESEMNYTSSKKIFGVDKKLLEEILRNLLTNAYKFNKPGGNVLFKIEFKKGNLNFEIKDSGIGIPENEIKNIFEPFTRSSISQHVKGTGLGLSITKNAVEALGGGISLESNETSGTVIKVVIPVKQRKK